MLWILLDVGLCNKDKNPQEASYDHKRKNDVSVIHYLGKKKKNLPVRSNCSRKSSGPDIDSLLRKTHSKFDPLILVL